MALLAYIVVVLVAVAASLGGLMAVWIPLTVIAGMICIRFELLALLGLLAGIKTVSELDRTLVPDPDPA